MNSMIFFKKINGKETNRIDILYYVLLKNKKRFIPFKHNTWIDYTKEAENYKKIKETE